nr:hypothetical protein [Hyphomonas sp. Mor2]
MIRNAIVGTALIGAALSGSASADEVWSTEIGDVIYEIDLENGMAVLSYPTDGEARGRAYLSGLAGVYTGRTGYEGIWIEPEVDPETETDLCDVAMVAPDSGEASSNWGRVRVVFVDPDFPSTFVAMRGDCFDEPSEMLVARPVTAFSQ